MFSVLLLGAEQHAAQGTSLVAQIPRRAWPAFGAIEKAASVVRRAGCAANAREWGRIAMAVARLTGKRIGIDTGTRMAANADFTSEPKGRSFTISPILSGRRANRRIEAHSGGTMMRNEVDR